MNYKIRVNNEAESKEVQELFQQLGYNRRPYLLTNERMHNDGYPDDYEIGFLFAEGDGYISCADKTSTTFFTDHRFKEITIQQLKDLVVLKRNDIQDATHTSYSKFYYLTDNEFYEYIEGKWVNVDEFVDGLEFKGVNHNTEEPMTEDNQRLVDHSDLFDKIRKGEISFDFSEMKTERDGDVVENPQTSKPSELFKDDCERDSNYPKMKAERILCVKVDEFSEVNDKQIEWVKSRVKSNGDNRKAITVTITPNEVKVKWFKKFLDGVKVQCRVIGTKGWQNMTWKSLEKMKLNIEFREKPTTVEVDGMKFDTVDKLTSYLKSMTNLK